MELETRKAYFAALAAKYTNGTITEAEREEFTAWFNDFPQEGYELKNDPNIREALSLVKLQAKFREEKPRRLRPMYVRLISVAAASSVIFAFFYLYHISTKDFQQTLTFSKTKTVDALPGGQRAVLTLADGSTIDLDDANSGKLSEQSGVTVSKSTDGVLIYTIKKGINGDQISEDAYNTISTPKGGEYQVKLPDGTSVWLNSQSSLKYPTRFSNTQRSVELNGEAYFEVIHNDKLPFIVKTYEQEIKVLGTHFNVSSYADDPTTQTSLIEGSVNVASLHSKSENPIIRLTPGVQAITMPNGRLDTRKFNHEAVMAWKNGLFVFTKADIQTVMRVIARWYNIEVVYKGEIPQKQITGDFPKKANLSSVLEMLASFRINCKIVEENNVKKIIITP